MSDRQDSATPRENAGMARTLGWLFASAGVFVALGFLFRTWRPEVATVHGEIVDRVIDYLLVIVGIFIIAGHLVLGLWIVGSRNRDASTGNASRRAEVRVAIAVVLVMAIVSESGVIVLALPAWEQMYGDPPDDAFVVEVVGKQFGWIVRYPGEDGEFGAHYPEFVDDMDNPLGLDDEDEAAEDDIVIDGLMHLPVDRPIVVRLRSHDVLHSFTVVHMRVKQDVVPGLITSVQFEVTRTGDYEIACAELCGLGHYKMRGVLKVQSAADFASWIAEQETFQ